MKFPFQITPEILKSIEEISRILGKLEGIRAEKPQPLLRKRNRIKTIHGSTGIEGNTLSMDQITALLDGKRVVGSKKEIQEIINTNELYNLSQSFNCYFEKDFLKAHKILMNKLTPDAGRYRNGNVGVLEGKKVIHIAPQPHLLSELMKNLFHFLNTDKNLSGLIKSAVFHYETEFIHPFSDGNGRMGRFWQHLILENLHPIFQYIPIESVIRKYQKSYYQALKQSDHKGESTDFIKFSLKTILEALHDFEIEVRPSPLTVDHRLEQAKEIFGNKSFSRNDYLHLFKMISTATASRDLQRGVINAQLKRSGTKAKARYHFKTS